MAQRPAKQLETELRAVVDVEDTSVEAVLVPLDVLNTWYKLAKKINASMRLDGSKAGKRKPKKA